MKANFLLGAILIVVFASCSSTYRSGQTPDDVYYSPVRNYDVEEESEREFEEEETDAKLDSIKGSLSVRNRAFRNIIVESNNPQNDLFWNYNNNIYYNWNSNSYSFRNPLDNNFGNNGYCVPGGTVFVPRNPKSGLNNGRRTRVNVVPKSNLGTYGSGDGEVRKYNNVNVSSRATRIIKGVVDDIRNSNPTRNYNTSDSRNYSPSNSGSSSSNFGGSVTRPGRGG